MRSLFYFALGSGMLYSQGASIIKWIGIAGRLNYLTLVLIAYGIIVLKHLARVFLLGEETLLSGGFISKSFWMLGLTLGLPYYLQHLMH